MELHFASKDEYAHITCKGCPKDLQIRRACHTDKWDHPIGGAFPIRLIEGTEGHGFCPGKIIRDENEFHENMQKLWLSWKMGIFPGADSIDEIDDYDFHAMSAMIRIWEEYERRKDYRFLGQLLGG